MRVNDDVALGARDAASAEEGIESDGRGEKSWESECERERRRVSELLRGGMVGRVGGRSGSSSE